MKDPENTSGDRQRQHERDKTLHSVNWTHNKSEHNPGKIRDISSSGIFLAPVGIKPDHIKLGEPLLVVLPMNKKNYVFSTKVRWSGMSPVHGEYGFDLEFDEKVKEGQPML